MKRERARLVKFDGVRELATFLADSEEAHTAFVQQLFHYLVKQPVRAFGYRANCPTSGDSSRHTILIFAS